MKSPRRETLGSMQWPSERKATKERQARGQPRKDAQHHGGSAGRQEQWLQPVSVALAIPNVSGLRIYSLRSTCLPFTVVRISDLRCRSSCSRSFSFADCFFALLAFPSGRLRYRSSTTRLASLGSRSSVFDDLDLRSRHLDFSLFASSTIPHIRYTRCR